MTLNANALTSLANVKVQLGISVTTEDAFLERLINVASQQIERHCNRKFKSTAYTESFDGPMGNQIVLPQYPVTAIAGVWVDSTRVFASESQLDATDISDADQDLSRGLLRRVTGLFPKGVRNIKVTFTAGYSSIEAQAPDLEYACILLVEMAYRSRSDRRIGRRSISRGEESVSYLTEWPIEVIGLLDAYRREFFDAGQSAGMW